MLTTASVEVARVSNYVGLDRGFLYTSSNLLTREIAASILKGNEV